jgi:hypothetical protein
MLSGEIDIRMIREPLSPAPRAQQIRFPDPGGSRPRLYAVARSAGGVTSIGYGFQITDRPLSRAKLFSELSSGALLSYQDPTPRQLWTCFDSA